MVYKSITIKLVPPKEEGIVYFGRGVEINLSGEDEMVEDVYKYLLKGLPELNLERD